MKTNKNMDAGWPCANGHDARCSLACKGYGRCEWETTHRAVTPSKPGYYWIRHVRPIKGRWQPVMVDELHGVLGFKKFGWAGWMTVSEAVSAGLEWGSECIRSDDSDKESSDAEENHLRSQRPE